MPQFGTPAVALATTPTVISTFFSHLFARKSRKAAAKNSLSDGGPGGGPENELSYEEGLKVVRRFLEFASHNGVEEVQAFTAMKVPNSPYVRRDVVRIPDPTLRRAEDLLSEHLSTYGPDGQTGGGLKLIGGDQWWRIRGRELEGEWIEMQKDYLRRTATTSRRASTDDSHRHHIRHSYLPSRSNTGGSGSIKDSAGGEVSGDRVILYIHGGAYFFSSLDTHRYQIQRHARKAGARAFAPAYRLAPQYPFPCGLLDALASYLYLIDPPPNAHVPILPTAIILMGDSAGAGMVVALLIIIREMGLPMPAGASLISPWVDLTHSMPSIGGDDSGDFIPNTGFHYKPSCAWPPPPGDGITVTMPDGSEQHFDEQIQMYCPNNLLTHPLVSPVNLGSLGGLCPLLITGGGGELLRDEIIYLAHKAAAPTTYMPSSATLSQYPDQKVLIDKYKPTRVHLQIYEGCCHVVPTLAITKSAKYMYRACANFNIWAFTAASKALERRLHHSSRRHRSRDRSSKLQTSLAPSRSDSTASPIETKVQPFTQSNLTSSPAISRRQSFTDTPPNGQSTIKSSTAPSSTMGSAAGSQLDLTKPIINEHYANWANDMEIDEDDVQSEAGGSSESESDRSDQAAGDNLAPSVGIVTVLGREPLFDDSHIVCERISTHGKIRPFEPIDQIPALNPRLRETIGQVHGDGAIQNWLRKRAEWDSKYSSSHKKWREIKISDRMQAEENGFLTRKLHGERPPLCSLAGWYDSHMARLVGQSVDEISGKTSNMMMMWQKISQKPDREQAGGETMEEIKEGVEESIRRKSVTQSDRPQNLPTTN